MPLMRYFLFVGGVLLALLVIVNACLPGLPVAERSAATVDRSVIRIHSDRKWPERVVFDTTQPAITPTPAPSVAEASLPQKTAEAQPLKGEVRAAFAQMSPNPVSSNPVQPKRKHKSVAKSNSGVSTRILVAQQPPVMLFGNNIW